MECVFCGSEIQPDEKICPRCGADQSADGSIPPPSPFYNEVIPLNSPLSEIKKEPVIPLSVPESPPSQAITIGLPEVKELVRETGVRAIISLILGIAGILLSFFPGCFIPFNIIGIFLARADLKSDQPKLARIAIMLNTIAMILDLLIILVIVVLWIIFVRVGGNSSTG